MIQQIILKLAAKIILVRPLLKNNNVNKYRLVLKKCIHFHTNSHTTYIITLLLIIIYFYIRLYIYIYIYSLYICNIFTLYILKYIIEDMNDN